MAYSRETITRHTETKEVISDIFLKDIWKNSQEKLLNIWSSELREELRCSDEVDKEYLEAILFRIEALKERIKQDKNAFR